MTMSALKILLAEISYRKANFALSLAAVVVAVVLFVAGPMLIDGYQRETRLQIDRWSAQVAEAEAGVAELQSSIDRFEKNTAAELDRTAKETTRLMLNLGFNLMIVRGGTNMSDFWAADFASGDFPQDYVDRLARDPHLTMVRHLVATLQAKIPWENRNVLLVGYLPETRQVGDPGKRPMGYKIEPGTVLLGHELGAGRKPGEKIRVLDKPFRVAKILPEQGSKQDITIAMHLSDAQALLNKPQRINQIMALGCLCVGYSLPNIRKQVAAILPDTQVTEFESLAVTRAEERNLVEGQQAKILTQMKENLRQREKTLAERQQAVDEMTASRQRIQRVMETLANGVTPLVVLAAAVWVGLLAWSNVRQRRTEIGLLKALGKRPSMIASLLLGKAVLLGLLGAAIGLVLGIGLARWLGTRALELAPDHFHASRDVLIYVLAGAPLLSAVASYLPTLGALLQDPAVVLREQ
jgi:putative ABC transport system permease protein